MSYPSITYNHRHLSDGDGAIGDWVEGVSGILAADASIATNGEVLTLTGKCDAAADEKCWYTKDITNISSATYATIRWKTEVGSNGLGARAAVVYTDASVQDLLEAAAVPQFSTTWTTTTTELSIPGGESVDKIRFYADDYPNSVDAGTFEVYFDFMLLHEATFSFPYAHVVPLDIENVYADLHPPGRIGEISQYMGMKSPEFRVLGTIDWDDTTNWGNPLMRNIYTLFQEADADPWQWFISDLVKCKATPRKFHLVEDKDTGAVRGYTIDLKKYDNLWHSFSAIEYFGL